MKVLVCGDRHWTDRVAIGDRLARLPEDSVIIHGGASGADTLAGEIAKERGYPVMVFYAGWRQYGRAAGPIRNQDMIDQKPDLVLAFHKDIQTSRGTADTLNRARKAEISWELHDEKGGLSYEDY